MKFIAPEGKQVIYNGQIITAKDGGFETDDKDLIEVLKQARDVKQEVKPQRKPSDKSEY
jgi:SepF-like predicted cell division protein (DUF552 family)